MYGLIFHCFDVITVALQTDQKYSESVKVQRTSSTEQRRWMKEKLNSTPDTAKIPALLAPMAPQHGIVVMPTLHGTTDQLAQFAQEDSTQTAVHAAVGASTRVVPAKPASYEQIAK